MRHAALAVLLVASPAAASDLDFENGLRLIQDQVRRVDGSPRFQKTDFVKPTKRPALSQLEKEQQDLYDKSVPATFIVRLGERGKPGSGTGSGYFIDPDGTGMTNVHVVGAEIGKEVEIETARGVKKAKVLAAAPGRDIAIIKVSNDAFNDWSALTMAGQLKAGALVFAIGNPADQGVTFTRGIVSRPAQDQLSPWQDVLQLDIQLNPGNSGGALINSDGGLVGMNQAVARSASIDGIGYAIPVQELKRAYDEFKATGKLVDGVTSLGVVGDELTVLKADGAPAQAGFKPGDAIVDFPNAANAVPGRRSATLYRAVGRAKVGTAVAVSVVRGEAAKLHTANAAGGKPNASVDGIYNPATGILLVPGTPLLGAFIQSVTQASVEEVVIGKDRFTVEPLGQPTAAGMLFSINGYKPVAGTRVTLNLPVEEYKPSAAPSAHSGPRNAPQRGGTLPPGLEDLLGPLLGQEP